MPRFGCSRMSGCSHQKNPQHPMPFVCQHRHVIATPPHHDFVMSHRRHCQYQRPNLSWHLGHQHPRERHRPEDHPLAGHLGGRQADRPVDHQVLRLAEDHRVPRQVGDRHPYRRPFVRLGASCPCRPCRPFVHRARPCHRPSDRHRVHPLGHPEHPSHLPFVHPGHQDHPFVHQVRPCQQPSDRLQDHPLAHPERHPSDRQGHRPCHPFASQAG